MTNCSDHGMRLAVIFDRLGPYHDVRLRCAARQGDVVAIERSSHDEDGVYSWEEIGQTAVYRKMKLSGDGHSGPLRGGRLQRRLADCLEQIQPDVVAIPGWSTFGALAALRWCVESEVPAIVMSDSWDDGRRRRQWKDAVKRHIIPFFASGLVAGSPHHDYLEALGMPRKQIFRGYDVVDNGYFLHGAAAARRNPSTNRERLSLPASFFLSVCRFITEKNLAALIHAYAKYTASSRGDPWHLVLVGDGPLRIDLEALRRQLHLDEYLQFPGFKQYSDLPSYYGLARAFILPSISETWGLVVNEAMSAGLPVLVSNRCGCCRDMVENGRNGFSFDPFDTDAICDVMTRIASADCDLRAMGRASQQMVSHWPPALFADSLWRAARCAAAVPRRRAGLLSNVVLAVASRRRVYA